MSTPTHSPKYTIMCNRLYLYLVPAVSLAVRTCYPTFNGHPHLGGYIYHLDSPQIHHTVVSTLIIFSR
ncbi:hypothetical protein K469DRAFT_703012 [Zopfia rhizophila CBS 207.26]|uniref:Uncharacterized protein n=1 Tax=Zopfia rhizophila CBS 207.26 TaxID=1314779 RepID=A0A6A6D6Y7_9PEZI|nr:hypothetical protein K469DRAFT_703012 [Zopfia rhizophila CBS 207.26]